jgi:hypothetical protein
LRPDLQALRVRGNQLQVKLAVDRSFDSAAADNAPDIARLDVEGHCEINIRIMNILVSRVGIG